MNRTTKMTLHFLGTFVRAALVTAAVAAPLMMVQGVRAGTSQFIGETPTMSNGTGLVIMVSLQRS